MAGLYDSHCHLNDEAFASVEETIKSAENNAGIDFFLVVGWNYESSKRAVELAKWHKNIYAAVGVHPENYEEEDENTINKLRELAKNEKVVAIGEIGLDYHWKNDQKTKEDQKEWFIKQIKLANTLGLPVTIHGRDATQDLYEILKTNPILHGFVLHCYSGSVEMMKEFAKLGAYFGFDGPITYKNAITPKECVKACPLERLLIETDSPYLPPVPYRGKRNEPKYIVEVFRTVSELRGIDEKTLLEQLNRNLESLFKVERK